MRRLGLLSFMVFLGCDDGASEGPPPDCREMARACSADFVCQESAEGWACVARSDGTDAGPRPDADQPDAGGPDAAGPDAAAPDAAPSDEVCDGLDNDLDGTIDEGSSAACPAGPGFEPACLAGTCTGACTLGRLDLDGDAANGCEAPGVRHTLLAEVRTARVADGELAEPVEPGDPVRLDLTWDPSTPEEGGYAFRYERGFRAVVTVGAERLEAFPRDGSEGELGINPFDEGIFLVIIGWLRGAGDGEWTMNVDLTAPVFPELADPPLLALPPIEAFEGGGLGLQKVGAEISATVTALVLTDYELSACATAAGMPGECRRSASCAAGPMDRGDCLGPAFIGCCPVER